MLLFGKLRGVCFVLFLILINFGGGSCGKKIYPSGLEGDLMGYKSNFQREQRKRQRIARRADRKQDRLKRKAARPQKWEEFRQKQKHKRLVREHMRMQDDHVQARMKRNQRETNRKYRSKKSWKERLFFWRNRKCK